MLKVLRRKLRKSRSPSPETLHLGPSKEETEREMALTAELRKVLSSFQSCRSNALARPTAWTSVIPLELIYHIIDLYYFDDFDTLRALSRTCNILSSYCRKYLYRTVTVTPNTATPIDDPSIPEIFARLVVQAPQILDHIQNFNIAMRNRYSRSKFGPMSRGEESIVFLLSRRMKNLLRLKIEMRADWRLLPDPVQDAISISFQSPTLQDISIKGIHSLPLNIFLHVKSLEHLDFRCDAAPPSSQEEPPSFTVHPKMIHLHDPRASTVRYLFGERSSLSTSQLCGLSFFGGGRALSTLEAYFPSFSSSLTRLELDPGTLGGVPDVPDLSRLPILRYLTLTVDMVVSLSETLIGEALPRWQWLIDTLNTCAQPSAIQNFHIVVHTNSPKQSQLYDWRALDSVFDTLPSTSWLALEVVNVSICAEFDFHRGHIGTDFFDRFLPGEMANLVSRGIHLQGRYSPRSFHGQLAQRRLQL